MSWSEKFFDEVGVRGEQIPIFSRFPLENRPFFHCGRGFARITFLSLIFWRSGAYKKYPRSYGADHRVCGDHCPTSGHSGPRTPVNDLVTYPRCCDGRVVQRERLTALQAPCRKRAGHKPWLESAYAPSHRCTHARLDCHCQRLLTVLTECTPSLTHC